MHQLKRIYQVGFGVIITFLLVCIALFFMRGYLLNGIIHKTIASRNEKDSLNIHIEKAEFKGIKTISFQNVSIVPIQKDSLVYIEKLELTIDFLPLFFGKIKLNAMDLENAKIRLTSRGGVRNYDFLLNRKKQFPDSASATPKNTSADLSKTLYNGISLLLTNIPEYLNFQNIDLDIVNNHDSTTIHLDHASLIDKRLTSLFIVDNKTAAWHLNGEVSAKDKQADIRLYAENKKVELTYLFEKYQLKLNFDTLNARLVDFSSEHKQLKIKGGWQVSNLLIHHPKISEQTILIDKMSLIGSVFLGSDAIGIDSSSTIGLNNIIATPYLRYTRGKDPSYEFKLTMKKMEAQPFFDSFPPGLFNTLSGIKIKGELAYSLYFYMEENNPQSLQLNAGFSPHAVQIEKFGKNNLKKINSSFVYTPYEGGKPMRKILVGTANPDFTPIDTISPYLKNAILIAEDPGFFSHRGFSEEDFRQSFITNYQSKGFKRGASTLSMQLVKNIYLDRQKTLARKLEEMMIVWLIENCRLVSKKRLFEVYLNIIEWAPNVYGVAEASRFYFNKHPSTLNLGESIFLTALIPSPKKYRNRFHPNGALKPNISNYYFSLISNIMLKQGKINENDLTTLYDVSLKGPARNFVVTDSIAAPLDEEMKEDDYQRIYKLNELSDKTPINIMDEQDVDSSSVTEAAKEKKGLLQRSFNLFKKKKEKQEGK